jgi:beta-glucosidase
MILSLKYMISLLVIIVATARAANVDDLLASMTLEEKVGQMNQIDIAVFVDTSIPGLINYTKIEEWITKYKIGSILNTPFAGGQINDKVGWNASEFREVIHNIQMISQKYSDTEAAIPILYGIDSIHGSSYVYEATLFPQEISTAATFNTSHSYNAGRVAAQDTIAAGIPWLFSPVLGLALNPLWARFWETFGEDPYLAARMGEALVVGMQADDGYEDSVPPRAAACMKHFIAYSDPSTGHDRAPVQLPDRILKELYLPSFQAAVDAGVLTAMEGYHEVGGMPMVSSYDYLAKLLRYDMKFEGLLVTDYQEIINLHKFHMTAATENDAVMQSISETTIDMSMVPLDNSFFESTVSLVQSGVISMDRIDDSVRRILEVKNTLGLLDNPVVPLDDPLLEYVGQSSDWEISLNSARECITLAKNNQSVLPISPESIEAGDVIFVTGPTAKSLVRQTGGDPKYALTIKQ